MDGVDEFVLPGMKVIKLTGRSNFTVKKLLSRTWNSSIRPHRRIQPDILHYSTG